jgi:hypothetical protein
MNQIDRFAGFPRLPVLYNGQGGRLPIQRERCKLEKGLPFRQSHQVGESKRESQSVPTARKARDRTSTKQRIRAKLATEKECPSKIEILGERSGDRTRYESTRDRGSKMEGLNIRKGMSSRFPAIVLRRRRELTLKGCSIENKAKTKGLVHTEYPVSLISGHISAKLRRIENGRPEHKKRDEFEVSRDRASTPP